jgi:hypothetical protein
MNNNVKHYPLQLVKVSLDVARRVPTVAVGGQCVKFWWQFAVEADTL